MNTKKQSGLPTEGKLAKKIATYSVAATAAVGVAGEVNAGVVYDDFEDIVLQGPLGGSLIASIDLDDNGVVDFQLGHQSVTPAVGTAVGIPCEGFTNPSATNNRFAMQQTNGAFYLQNLAAGTPIDETLPNLGSGGTQTFGYLAYGSVADCADCEFTAPSTGFLGLSFDVGGQTNYGWIRVGLDEGNLNRLTIFDAAYNDMGQAIQAGQVPEPGSLGLLALGGAGLLAWRRRRDGNK